MLDRQQTTLTFLFTDIEGSTRLWDTQREAMSVALARHDALLRTAIERHGGHVFKTVGDAFCAAFPSPTGALSAAVDGQRALVREEWAACGLNEVSLRVRMAVHSGAAEERDGDFFGPPLNRSARLLAAGHGGQVLLSQAVEQLARDGLGADLTLRDLGEHRLKDLTRPERVFQLMAPGLPAEFPPLASLDVRRNNLPLQLTSFVGREAEVVALKAALRPGGLRLATLTGPGGTGKTRLALQVAAEFADTAKDGAWLVELADCNDARLLAAHVAAALNVKEQPTRPWAAVLAEHLRELELLVVLDNCEHLVSACAELVEQLLGAAPQLCILATSREALRIAGERAWPVDPLPVPDVDHLPADVRDQVAAVSAYAAVKLFVERASAARAHFSITPANAAAVAAICSHLDGIPLAIELAAARCRHMDPQAILQRLTDRFRLLSGGSRTAPARQQTLAAAIAWSHDLLAPAERMLFRRLAVFRGGWTIEAAEAVCGDRGGEVDGAAGTGTWLDPLDVLDGLSHLVDRSLVQLVPQALGESRYRMLESIRAFAQEQLLAAGERPAMVQRHLAWFAEQAAETERQRHTAASGVWLSRLDGEVENLRAAIDHVIAGEADPEPGFRLAGNLWWLWVARLGNKREWLVRADALLGHFGTDVSPEACAMVHYSAGTVAHHCGEIARAEREKRTSLALAETTGDERLQAWCLNDLANFARAHGDLDSAEDLMLASLAIKERLAVLWDIGMSQRNLAYIVFLRGDMSATIEWLRRSVSSCRRADSPGPLATALSDLGYILTFEGAIDAARAAVDEARTCAERSAEHLRQAEAYQSAGVVAWYQGRWPEARRFWARSSRHWRTLDVISSELLGYAALLAAAAGETDNAAYLAGAYAATPERPHSMGIHPRDRADLATALEAACSAADAVAWDRAYQAGVNLRTVAEFHAALAWLDEAPTTLEPVADDEPRSPTYSRRQP